jgi:hypothetical protein
MPRPAPRPVFCIPGSAPPSAFSLQPSAFSLQPSAFRLPPSAFRLPPSAFGLRPFGLSALRTRRLVQGEHAMLRVTAVTNFSRRKRRGHSSRNTAPFINILDILYVEGWLINPPSPTGFGSRGIKSLGPRSRREFKKEPGSGSENNPCLAEQDAGNRTLDCDPKPTTGCPHPETGNLEFGIWNLEFGILNLESQAWSGLGFRHPDPAGK